MNLVSHRNFSSLGSFDFYLKRKTNMEYRNITTYNPMADITSDYDEINELIKQNLETHTMPYNFEKPFPVNVNVISGKSANVDMNFDKLELKARSIGAENTMWIYGADAEYLGLELKTMRPAEYKAAKLKNKNFNCKPITIQRQRERLADRNLENRTDTLNESLCIDKQCAYLLDQFTEESVSRLFDEKLLRRRLSNYPDSEIERVKKHVGEFIKNRERYNENLERDEVENGKYTVETKEERNERYKNIRRNVFLNCNKNTPVFKEVVETRKNFFSKYTQEQKEIFDYAYKLHNNQSCPKDDVMHRFSPEQKERLDKAFSSLMSKIDENPKIKGIAARTLFDGFSFSQRLTHHNFSLDPIFTQEEERAKKINLQNRPKALQQEADRSILDEKAKKKLRQRSFSMHVGQDIGM